MALKQIYCMEIDRFRDLTQDDIDRRDILAASYWKLRRSLAAATEPVPASVSALLDELPARGRWWEREPRVRLTDVIPNDGEVPPVEWVNLPAKASPAPVG